MSRLLAVALAGGVLAALSAAPAPAAFTIGNPGGTWAEFGGQNFSLSVEPSPSPGLDPGDTVYLTAFTFTTTGEGVGAANTRLTILEGAFPDLNGRTAGNVTGLSTNAFDSSATVSTVMAFSFDNLPLVYGNTYTAAFVTVGPGDSLTFFNVTALGADWNEIQPGVFRPSPNYGGDTGNYWNTAALFHDPNNWFNAFDFGGDASFSATFSETIPEPATAALCLTGLALSGATRPCHRKNV